MTIHEKADISILGGGAAGLAVGYYAAKAGKSFTIFEAESRVGGLCKTNSFGPFYYDLGAHRQHGKDSSVIHEMKSILGSNLSAIDLPSQIYLDGQYYNFPLSPINLMKRLGIVDTLNAAAEFLRVRFQKQYLDDSFESFAVYRYGKYIAKQFLLNYSEKLWGLPACQLSTDISGKRLEGLSLSSFIIESLTTSKIKARHLDGTFYYPEQGFGQITEKLAEYIDTASIRLNTRGTRDALHDDHRIHTLEINGEQKIQTGTVVSKLPLPDILNKLNPSPPPDILDFSRRLRYRSLILFVFLINQPSVTTCGTVYFPDSTVPFTRISEPKNCSVYMAPRNQTSLLIKVPWNQDTVLSKTVKVELISEIQLQLKKLRWVKPKHIIDVHVQRLNYAYPLLELGYEKKLKEIEQYLGRFTNLRRNGRSSLFQYIHFHDVMARGREIAREL
ncbi:MAG: FAD-dependent oxidoreductase [candidate division KSB1 bacterium]|nr:FAD-dependent oxidoreductase [candidate division KSB1 bacterium]